MKVKPIECLWVIAKLSFSEMVSRQRFIASAIFANLLILYTRIAIWNAAYRGGDGATASLSLRELVTYTIVAGTIGIAWQPLRVVGVFGDVVKTGDIASELTKPLSFCVLAFGRLVGEAAFRTSLIAFPVSGLAIAIYGITPPSTPSSAICAGILFLIGAAISFLIASIFGIVAIRLLTPASLEWLLQGIMGLMSGTFVPLWFFPRSIADVIAFSPFAFLGFLPTATYLGRLESQTIVVTMALGILWLLFFYIVAMLLWRRTLVSLAVNGG